MFRLLMTQTAWAVFAAGWLLLFPGLCRGESGPCYAARPSINLRGGPNTGHAVVKRIAGNDSLACLEKRDGWCRVACPDGTQGWVRNDLLSRIVVRITNKDDKMQVFQGCIVLLEASVDLSDWRFGNGRYFSRKQDGRLVFGANRQDLRGLLARGKMSYQAYVRALRSGPKPDAQLAVCSEKDRNEQCRVAVPDKVFQRLMATVPDWVRVETYADSGEEAQLDSADDLSRRIDLGALEQLKYPAAGLGPFSKVPGLGYPGGDIQPDFATSADIVVRAVRRAGLDLQALVHEDMLLSPEAYEHLGSGPDGAAEHRRIPVLFTWFRRHSLSLPLSVIDDPFAFEGGDIVFFGSTASDGRILPDHAGVVCETFNRAGQPLVITVWDMGQTTRKLDLLGRLNPKVVGHFRMTHLFDYQ